MPQPVQVSEIPYSEFKDDLAAGQVLKVEIDEASISGEMVGADGAHVSFTTRVIPTGDAGLVDELEAAGIPYGVGEPASPDPMLMLLRLLPSG